MRQPKPGSQRGMTLPMLALFIVVLFAMAALSIDVGLLFTARTSAQHAADAAALAGAFSFLDSNNTQPAAAVNAAIAVASSNKVLGDPVVINAANVSVDTSTRRVTVTVPRTGSSGIATVFANVIGISAVNIQAQATAEASRLGAGTHCLKPVFIANTVASSNPADVACDQGEVLFNANGDLTSFARSRFGQSVITLRPVGPPNTNVPSQYASLDFGAGADTYSCTLGHCLNYPGCKLDSNVIRCGDVLATQNGNNPQKTYFGIGDLIGDFPDTWGGQGANGGFQFFLGGDSGQPVDTSRSLAVAPVWDNCTTAIGAGKQSVKLIGFVQVFVDGVEKGTGNIIAHLVNASACSVSNTPTIATGPFAVPLRLVQRPPEEKPTHHD